MQAVERLCARTRVGSWESRSWMIYHETRESLPTWITTGKWIDINPSVGEQVVLIYTAAMSCIEAPV